MSHGALGRARVAGLQPAQVLAGIVGLVFLVGGIIGLVRTGLGDFAGSGHPHLLWFGVNPLHNIVHVVIGVLGLIMAAGSASARTFGWLLFVVFGALFVWGLMLTGVLATNVVPALGNPLNLNASDSWLHGITAAVGLVIAAVPARRKVIPGRGPVVAPEPRAEAQPRAQGLRGLFRHRKEAPH